MHGLRSGAQDVEGRRRRRRGVLIAVAATLGLALGAAATLLAVRDALLDTPLPYDVDDRLALVWNRLPDAGYERLPLSDAEWHDHRRALRSSGVVEAAAAFVLERSTLLGSGPPRALSLVRAEPELMVLLGLDSTEGLEAEFQAELGGDDVCVVSHRAWREHFASEPGLVGRRIDLDGVPRRVVGVLPEAASFPPHITWQGRTTGDGRGADVFVPFAPDPKRARSDRRLMAVARLAPDVGLGAAKRVLETSALGLVESHPREHPPGLSAWAVSLHGQSVEAARPTLRTLALAVMLVVLVACANVSLLLLARSVERRGEVAIRAALGARRRHLLSSALVANLRLAGAAGAVALATASAACVVIRRSELPDLPGLAGLAQVEVDLGVTLSVLVLAIACGVATGLAPAWRVLRGELSGDLKGARGAAGGPRLRGVQSSLVVAELAMAVMLLAVSAVLVQDFLQLLRSDPGFRHAGVAHLDLRLDPRQADGEAVDRLLRSVRALPEVGQAAAATAPPLSAGLDASAYHVDFGNLIVSSGSELVLVQRVTPGYLHVLDVPTQAGDSAPAEGEEGALDSAVVSVGLARRLTGDPEKIDPGVLVGARLTLEDPRDPQSNWLTISGVAGHLNDRTATVYLPMSSGEMPERLSILAAAQPGSPIPAERLRQAVWQADPSLPVEVEALGDRVEQTLDQPRLAALLLASFAALVALLGAVGVHGVLAFQVARRGHEVALRQALGATLADIRSLFLRQAVSWAVAGVGVGLLLSWIIGRALRSQLPSFRFEWDHLGLLLAASLLVLPLAWLAAWLPARRAAAVDPPQGLRFDG